MKNKIDVSVIIPVFNAQDTIGHLVHKLLSAQTLSTEVIVVDDGPTDETWAILSAVIDKRRVLLHQENQGVFPFSRLTSRRLVLVTRHRRHPLRRY